MIQSVETHGTLAEAQRAMGPMPSSWLVARWSCATSTPAYPRRGLVRSTDPTLTDIRLSGDGVTIGAGVTMATIATHRETTFLAPVARAVGGPQIRNMATVGGNLFAPHPYGDFAWLCSRSAHV